MISAAAPPCAPPIRADRHDPGDTRLGPVASTLRRPTLRRRCAPAGRELTPRPPGATVSDMAAAVRSPWLAIDAVTDRPAHARSLRRVHDAFHSGREVSGHVRAVVKQSWARSDAAGIDPCKTLAPMVMDEARDRRPLGAPSALRGAARAARPAVGRDDARRPHARDLRRARRAPVDRGPPARDRGDRGHALRLRCRLERGEAGTNALGTAIAVDHPVQIFSAEHVSRIVHPWQCSGAPIHDPETGAIIGVIDLTGHLKTAHPHTLSLVTAAAGMAEAYLRAEQQRRTQRMRELYCARIAGTAQPTALLNSHGKVIMSVPHGWADGTLTIAPGGADVALADGTSATAEPLAGGGHLVWRRPRPRQTPTSQPPWSSSSSAPVRAPAPRTGSSPSACARPSCSPSSRCVPRGSHPSSWRSSCTAISASPSRSEPRSAACAACSARRCNRAPTASPLRSTATSRTSSACSTPVS